MKNTFIKIGFVVLLLSLLSACSTSSFMDMSTFIRLFNSGADELNVSFDDFSKKIDEAENTYYTFFENDTVNIMLMISADDDNNIFQVKVYLPKTDSKGNDINLNSDLIKSYIKILKRSISAFAFFNDDACDYIISQLQLYDKNSYTDTGELTIKKDGYHFVYYSTEISSELTITNTFLNKIESTNKPESKPDFGDTTNLREEEISSSNE